MKQYVLFKSKKGNRYVFDRKKKKTLLCHPVLYYLLELEDSGRDLKKWVMVYYLINTWSSCMNNDFCFNNYNELLYSLDNTPRLPTGTCLPFSRKIFVTANGKILPCERINHEYALGTVDENGVNIDFEDIAVKYNNWFEKIVSQCHACYQSENCVQCIFYLDLSSDRTIGWRRYNILSH